MLNRLGMFTGIESVLIMLVLVGGGFLAYRQFLISKQLKRQNSQFWDLTEFEKGISHQIQRSAVQVDDMTTKNTAHIEDFSTSFNEQMARLRKRVQVLEDAGANNATSNGTESSTASSATPDAKQKAAQKKASQKDTRIASALEENTLRLHLQPIVELPSRNPAYFETSMQLKLDNGENMDPTEFSELANSGGIKPALDIKMLYSSVRMLRTLKSLKKTSGIFCQISRASLTNTKSCKTILDFLQANKTLKKSLVLEISQADFNTLNRRELKRFDSIADLGFPLALGQVQTLDIPVESIAAYGFEFIKIPIEKILQAGTDEDQNGFHAMPIANALSEHNVSVIASMVTQENEAISLIDMNMTYGQGVLFAPPRPVKPDLLGT